MRFVATHRRSSADPVDLSDRERTVVYTDESVTVEFELDPAEQQAATGLVVEELRSAGTRDLTRFVTDLPATGTRSVQLHAGALGIRCRLDLGEGLARFTKPVFVHVRTPPQVLTLMSMGGASLMPTPPEPGGPPDEPTNLRKAGIWVDAAKCRRRGIDPTFVADLVTNRNVQCNDMADSSCVNFLEHLALRLKDERLVDEIGHISGGSYTTIGRFAGLSHRVVLGKWENSEREPVRPPWLRTWEQTLDEYRSSGGRHVILIGQSQGGAKFAEMIKDDHWAWDDDLVIDLFVSWDSTHLFGGIDDVGERPRKVLGFHQHADMLHFQNGKPITGAQNYDLHELFSHNGIARSEFVHAKTAAFVQDAIEQIRNGDRRSQDAVTFRRTADGRLGTPIEFRKGVPGTTTAHAVATATAPVMFLAGPDRRGRTVRIGEHGLLLDVIGEMSLPSDVVTATSSTASGITYLILLTQGGTELIIQRIGPGGAFGPRVHNGRLTGGPLGPTWTKMAAIGVGATRFICLVEANGTATIVRLDASGTPGPPVRAGDLGSSSAIVGYSIGSQGYLTAIGEGISVRRIGQDGTLSQPIWQEPGTFGLALEVKATHARLGSAHQLVTREFTGRLRIRSIDGNGSIGPTVQQLNAGPTGRVSMTSFEMAGAAYLHILRS